MSWRIGIDTGGTFTDLVASDSDSRRVVLHKVHSTPDNPAQAVVHGILELAQRADIPLPQIDLIVHGTTVATNAVLQFKGARIAVLTTRGFRDILLIGRQNRPRLYDLSARRPSSLVSRSHILEIDERMAYDGSILRPLDEQSLQEAIDQLRRLDVEVVVVALLHSHINPEHERRVGLRLRRELSLPVTLSHEVTCTQGEFERFSTAVINGYVQPAMAGYLGGLEAALHEAGIDAQLFVMKSNGGVSTPQIIARRSVETLLSGPAGGVVAGVALAQAGGGEHLITADMGGTSFDVSVIRDGQPTFMQATEVAGLTLQLPMIDIHTIGAGGGSIGWIDAGGALRVGPQSAGAVPGPACYPRGGDEPTLTDANLVLGRIGTRSRLAGGMELNLAAAQQAIDRIAIPLKLTREQAAEGMIRIVNANMTGAIRKLTVERGYQPGEFAMCVFGGAGPLHGAELAREIGIPRVIVPLTPGVFSAQGLLTTNLREEQVQSLQGRLDDVAPTLMDVFEKMLVSMNGRLHHEAGCITRRLRLRYVGQGHDLAVGVDDIIADCSQIKQRFHETHERLFGYAFHEQPIEVAAAWISATTDFQDHIAAHDWPDAPVTPLATRPVYFDGRPHPTPVYDRMHFNPDIALYGPLIVEQSDTTTVVPPTHRLTLDDQGNLLIDNNASPKHPDMPKAHLCESV